MWPDTQEYVRPKYAADPGHLEQIYRRLQTLPGEGHESGKIEPRVLLLSDDAADVFELGVRQNDMDVCEGTGPYKGFVGMVLRLSLMAWASKGGREPETVSVATLAAVLEFVDDYAKPGAARVFVTRHCRKPSAMRRHWPATSSSAASPGSRRATSDAPVELQHSS